MTLGRADDSNNMLHKMDLYKMSFFICSRGMIECPLVPLGLNFVPVLKFLLMNVSGY